jgi:hypothetical protein
MRFDGRPAACKCTVDAPGSVHPGPPRPRLKSSARHSEEGAGVQWQGPPAEQPRWRARPMTAGVRFGLFSQPRWLLWRRATRRVDGRGPHHRSNGFGFPYRKMAPVAATEFGCRLGAEFFIWLPARGTKARVRRSSAAPTPGVPELRRAACITAAAGPVVDTLSNQLPRFPTK